MPLGRRPGIALQAGCLRRLRSFYVCQCASLFSQAILLKTGIRLLRNRVFHEPHIQKKPEIASAEILRLADANPQGQLGRGKNAVTKNGQNLPLHLVNQGFARSGDWGRDWGHDWGRDWGHDWGRDWGRGTRQRGQLIVSEPGNQIRKRNAKVGRARF